MEYPDTLRARVDRALEEKGAVALARLFHETYERFAPEHNYRTRKESAVAWEDVPVNNKNLMIAVCAEIIDRQGWQELQQRADSLEKKLVAAINEKVVVEEHLRQAYVVIEALNEELRFKA